MDDELSSEAVKLKLITLIKTCVMWFQASDTGKTTFSKCFVVLSVMLGGEFSFCFALGQIHPGDISTKLRIWDYINEGRG